MAPVALSTSWPSPAVPARAGQRARHDVVHAPVDVVAHHVRVVDDPEDVQDYPSGIT
jgi:hypothetical protein